MSKKLTYLISFVLALSVADNASADLVAYWRLDDGSGTTAKDTAGNNDGNLQGDATWAVGWIGGALELDGDDYVDCGNSDAFNITEQVTLAAWVRPDTDFAYPDWSGIIMRGGPNIDTFAFYYNGPGSQLGFKTTGTSPNWMATAASGLFDGEWHHVAAVYNGARKIIYLDGEEIGAMDSTGTIETSTGRLLLGAGRDTSPPTHHLVGMIDDARIYDEALTQVEIQAAMQGGEGYPYALGPDPADGAILAGIWVNLGWSPGDYAVSHDVYLGDNFDDVNDGTPDSSAFRGNQPLTSTTLFVGFFGCPYPDGLVPGTTYYWRIDEVNDTEPNSPWKGPVWSFWIPPRTAYDPTPADGAKFIDPNAAVLSWTAGLDARVHYVYFGDNFDDVNNTTGGLQQATTTYTPGTLELDKVYYWRVDEFDGAATHKGDVWSFLTLPVIPIVDPHLKGWWKLDEGYGNIAVDWSGHDNHGSLTGADMSWMPDDGMIGGALSFNGTASDTDYVEISTADISLAAGTVAMWAKLRPNPQLPATRYFFGHTTIPAWNDRIQLYMDNSDTMLDLGLGDSHARQTDIMNLTTETWYHVALTWDGANYVVYVNGEAKANGSYTGLDNLNTVADIGNDGNPGDRTEAFNGLLDNVRIYDYALSQAEIPLAMRGDPLLAWSLKPAPGSTLYIRDATPLSWSPGDNASGHDVYFGTDRDTVADANASDTTGVYRGRQVGTSYTPLEGVEWGGGPYYWRIDEYNTDATISEGRIWSFTVADFILVDDFEDYNDYEPYTIFDAWLDGWGVDTNGSQVGYAEPDFPGGEHFVETNIVHGGSQSMPLFYENNFKYSEATYSPTQRDWTEEGVGVLSLWFYGDAANAAERMYVSLNGGTGVYHGDLNAPLIDTWTEWTIDLQEFTGVNLTNVNTLAIGFGDKNNLQAGGSGLVFFDDIRLYQPAP